MWLTQSVRLLLALWWVRGRGPGVWSEPQDINLPGNTSQPLDNQISNVTDTSQDSGQELTAGTALVCNGSQNTLSASEDCGCPEPLVLTGESCSCAPGYSLQPASKQCTDVDECRVAVVTGLAACGVHTLCTNTAGSYTCDCEPGFVTSPETSRCVDVDECSFEELCRRELGNTCINTVGSYTCICRPGFQLQASSCVGKRDSMSRSFCVQSPSLSGHHCWG
uniref:EGF-like domain-containing protein n=1 Tax=Callorhinchus milii TaxID=7868 RepID=A0A4W3GJI4_CALMI